MMKHDARFSEAVASAVTEIERTTDAELVVVAGGDGTLRGVKDRGGRRRCGPRDRGARSRVVVGRRERDLVPVDRW